MSSWPLRMPPSSRPMITSTIAISTSVKPDCCLLVLMLASVISRFLPDVTCNRRANYDNILFNKHYFAIAWQPSASEPTRCPSPRQRAVRLADSRHAFWRPRAIFNYPRPLPCAIPSLASISTPLSHRLTAAVVAARRWVVLAMLLALHAALVSQPGRNFPANLAARALRTVPALAAVLRRRARARGASRSCCSFAITAATLYFLAGWMIVAWLLVLLGILGGRVFTIEAARRKPLLPGRVHLRAHDPAAVGRPRARARRTHACPRRVSRFVTSLLPFGAAAARVPAARPAQATTAGRCSISSTRCSSSSSSWCWCWARWRSCATPTTSTSRVGGAHGDRLRRGALRARRAVEPAARIRRIAHVLLALPAVGGHALRALDAPRGRARGDRAAIRAASSRRPLQEIGAFPWMRGGEWRSPDGEGRFGAAGAARHALHLPRPRAHLLHRDGASRPALFLHMRLLAQVVGRVLRGQAARERPAPQRLPAGRARDGRAAHARREEPAAVALRAHLDGAARTPPTATRACCSASSRSSRKRLHATLDKLRSPEVATRELPVAAQRVVGASSSAASPDRTSRSRRLDRGERAGARHALRQLRRERPRQCAREGRRASRASRIVDRASHATRGHVELAVCDTGSAVPEELVPRTCSASPSSARRGPRHRPLPDRAPRAAGGLPARARAPIATARCASRCCARSRRG